MLVRGGKEMYSATREKLSRKKSLFFRKKGERKRRQSPERRREALKGVFELSAKRKGASLSKKGRNSAMFQVIKGHRK